MNGIVRDLRHAARTLARARTFALTVLLTLSVCIGANVAIFGVVETVLLEPLPFDQPERLVTVYNSYPGAGSPRGGTGTVDFFQRREHVAAFQEVALLNATGRTVGEAGSTERVGALRATPSLFPLLGVEAALGRTFTEDEMEEGNHEKVLLTDAYWRERFGAARDVVGRSLRVDGRPFEVVGVLPADFRMADAPEARFVVPVAFDEDARQLENWHSNNFAMLARLAPGASVEQATAQNRALNDRLIEQWPLPNARQLLDDVGYQTVVVPALADMVRDVRPVLYMLWAGVGFVLLIGCVNVANLMLARGNGRAQEMATQLALGAGRLRVARQFLAEAVLLGVGGSVLGVGLGAAGLRVIRGLGADILPRGTEIGLDATVLAFTAVLALGAGVLFGAIPVAQLLRRDLSPVFRAGGRTGTSDRRSVALRNALVTGQVALAFVLLIGAGLMFTSFRAALDVDPGFEPRGVITAYVSLPAARYGAPAPQRQFLDELLREVRALPGVAAAGVTSQLPFTGQNSNSVITPEGYVPPAGESLLSPFQTFAGPGYFDAMGMELVQGRDFLEADGPDAPNVIIIDEWLAERYWPGRSPLGDRMVWGAPPGATDPSDDQLYTVVGVVRTVKHRDLTAPPAEHVGAYYFSYRQIPPSFVTLTVRVAGGEPASMVPELRRVLAGLDPELPLFNVRSMEERLDASLAGRRVPLMLLAVFAGVALFLAVVGIYGSLAYTVSQRTREIGVRMALGSAPGAIFRTVVGQGLRTTALGLVLGAGGAWLSAGLVRSLLFGVEATDVRVLVAVAAVLAVAAVVACAIPARRATRVDPVEALGG